MNVKILGFFAAVALFASTACTNELSVDPVDPNVPSADSDEWVDVTFSVAPEVDRTVSRAVGDGQTISKGKLIDMLIYAVYDENYTHLTQYGLGSIKSSEESSWNPHTITGTHTGQTIVNVGDVFPEGTYTFTLRLMRNKEYHLAFWAQCSKTDAYDTNDLMGVMVKYQGSLNNDEQRDAFCKVESFSVTPSETSREIILTRPFAQINVGTTYADYVYQFGKNTFGAGSPFTVSKIELTGVSNKINVVKDEIGPAMTDAVTLSYNTMPAYINCENIPTEKEDLLTSVEGEEFLRIDFNGDGQFWDYRRMYPTMDQDGNILTEEFKYYSMCYVLVPASKVPQQNENGDYSINDYTSTILSSVKVYLAKELDKDGNGIQETTIKSIVNVPVQRNWRTNILGGIVYGKPGDSDNNDPYEPDPDDPDNPDNPDNPKPTPPTPPSPDDPDIPTFPEDPSLFSGTVTFTIDVDPIYDGDKNKQNGTGNEWQEKQNSSNSGNQQNQ